MARGRHPLRAGSVPPESRPGRRGMAAGAPRSSGALVAPPALPLEDGPGSSVALCGDCRAPMEERGWNWLRASVVAAGRLKTSHSGVEPASRSRCSASATWPSRVAAIPRNAVTCRGSVENVIAPMDVSGRPVAGTPGHLSTGIAAAGDTLMDAATARLGVYGACRYLLASLLFVSISVATITASP